MEAEGDSMAKKLLMGNEAIALGAIRASVFVVTGYPGTPSSEIIETIAREKLDGVYVEWSVNEKSALETAAGAAVSGARSMVTMKQVGLNVASDPLMSLNYIGVKGGMVVVVADDPGPISSQTEQDTRHFGIFGKFMVFDPSTPEEAYTMIVDAFEYSEKYGRPVIFRPTTRVCHSYASIEILPDLSKITPSGFNKDGGRWAIFPKLSYESHLAIEKQLVEIQTDFSRYQCNKLSGGGVKGIAAGGVSRQYVREALSCCSVSCKLLEISTVPIPDQLCLEFFDGLDEVLVVEELDPVIERQLIFLCGRDGIRMDVKGKLSGHMPNAGEYTPDCVKSAIFSYLSDLINPRDLDNRDNLDNPRDLNDQDNLNNLDSPHGLDNTGKRDDLGNTCQTVSREYTDIAEKPTLPVRPPVLCAGCPHRSSFLAVKEAVKEAAKGIKTVYSGDIGCYTLGNAAPLEMVDTCLCMGAGITIAQGINRVEPDTLNFAFIGDSTFFHTGIPGIINAVYNNSNIIVIILDNSTTAMTGGQEHPGTGKTLLGADTSKIDIYSLVTAIGVDSAERVNVFDFTAAKEAVQRAVKIRGTRVVIFEGPCISLKKPVGSEIAERTFIDSGVCTGCGLCVRKVGCPAILHNKSQNLGKARIDSNLCTDCGLCSEFCPVCAIKGGVSR